MNDSTLEIIDKAKIIDKYLIDLFVFSIIDCNNELNTVAVKNDAVSATDPAVVIQFYYSRKTNKCFLEFRLNKIFREFYEDYLTSIKSTFADWLNANFRRKNDGTWLERLLPEDGKNENCDGSQLLTPFTIGYWKSLSGRYDFITDKIKILKDYNDMVFPTYPAEYLTKKNQIWNDYETDVIDFNEFDKRMYELNIEYDIRLDEKPRKDFEDFIRTVKELNKLYSQVQLTEDEKSEFIDSYMEIFAQYGSNPLVLEEKLNELYDETGIVRKLNDKVPELFELYKVEYENFFEKPLTSMNLVNDLPEFQENEEVWQFSDYFDFDDIAEDTDPNDNSESIIVLSYYDIVVNKESEE